MDPIHKMLIISYQTVKTQTASYLGLRYLSRPFWQATSVINLRTFTVLLCYMLINFLSL